MKSIKKALVVLLFAAMPLMAGAQSIFGTLAEKALQKNEIAEVEFNDGQEIYEFYRKIHSSEK